ncbi:hypothetical protein L484_026289 [Morus notabilis]|uniref:Oxidative stress 3 n=1 Tax=Morus notabilis TaxID=981085 RepID=W9R6N4_9ROSA|nr:uncharacterized protein LOC21408952 [Morus notabilis]EXB74592.1 hypothetical protein L484_026289 [Morus notabilis]
MDECCTKEMLQNQFSTGLYDDYAKKGCMVIMEGDHDHDHDIDDDTTYNPTTSTSSIGNSTSSNRSTSSSDLVEDASSSCSSSHSNGPLYELSELMAQLPIKRGLSKYFQGKSQSFTSLSKVRSIEDLAKKENPYNNRRKMKACKSYGGGLDAHKLYTLPKATISKKASRGSFSFTTRKSVSFLGTNRPPPLPGQKTSDVCV